MPEIAYTITVELAVDAIRQWAELDIYPDGFARSPAEIGKIEACRQWVAENPEYPNGTIVVAEINGSTAVLEQVEGEWWYAETAEALGEAFLKSGTPPVVVVRVLHTPPTMRDHLHEVGLTDEMITEIPDQWRHHLPGSPLGVIADACREAER